MFLLPPRSDATTFFRFWTETIFYGLISKLHIVGKTCSLLPKVLSSSLSRNIFVEKLFLLKSMERQFVTHSLNFPCNVKVPGRASLYFDRLLLYREKMVPHTYWKSFKIFCIDIAFPSESLFFAWITRNLRHFEHLIAIQFGRWGLMVYDHYAWLDFQKLKVEPSWWIWSLDIL